MSYNKLEKKTKECKYNGESSLLPNSIVTAKLAFVDFKDLFLGINEAEKAIIKNTMTNTYYIPAVNDLPNQQAIAIEFSPDDSYDILRALKIIINEFDVLQLENKIVAWYLDIKTEEYADDDIIQSHVIYHRLKNFIVDESTMNIDEKRGLKIYAEYDEIKILRDKEYDDYSSALYYSEDDLNALKSTFPFNNHFPCTECIDNHIECMCDILKEWNTGFGLLYNSDNSHQLLKDAEQLAEARNLQNQFLEIASKYYDLMQNMQPAVCELWDKELSKKK